MALLKAAMEDLGLSARAHDKVLRGWLDRSRLQGSRRHQAPAHRRRRRDIARSRSERLVLIKQEVSTSLPRGGLHRRRAAIDPSYQCSLGLSAFRAARPSVIPMRAKALATGPSRREAQENANLASPDLAWIEAIVEYASPARVGSGMERTVVRAPGMSPRRAWMGAMAASVSDRQVSVPRPATVLRASFALPVSAWARATLALRRGGSWACPGCR